MSGLRVELRSPLDRVTDFTAALDGTWTQLTALELAERVVVPEGSGPVALGDLATVSGEPDGTVSFVGDLRRAVGLGAGLAGGHLVIDGDVGDDVGLGMAGGTIEVRGSAGARAGAAGPSDRRGMTGGELVVHGDAGPGAGARMRRGLLAVGGTLGDHAGTGLIAGTVLACGTVGEDAGLWSKRGSIVALADVAIPVTYRYACTYQPPHLRLVLRRLGAHYGLPVEERHLSGLYRRYSGDLAELGKGEILAWTA